MKRLFIVLVILAGATTLFCALRGETMRVARAEIARREQSQTAAQELEQLRRESEELCARMNDTRQRLNGSAASAAADPLLEAFLANGLKHPTAEQAERLLAELGFDWQNPGDCLIVSKTSLTHISMPAINDLKLTDAVRAALGITPAEQTALETSVRQLSADYIGWLQTHLKRETPSGDVLAKYVLEPDPDFSVNALRTFTNLVTATLCTERSELFQQYAWNMMESLGMFGADRAYPGPTSMTIKRQGNYLQMELRQARSMMTCGLSPRQPLPTAFAPMFPGGWAELAQREGFELPEEFKKRKAQ